MRVLVQSLVVVLGLMVSDAVAGAKPAYTIADLGPVRAVAVNGAGVAAGTLLSDGTTQEQATLARKQRRPQPLGFLPNGTWSEALAVQGTHVVGVSSTGIGGQVAHGFAWIPGQQGLRDLGTLGGSELFSGATGVNGAGTIAGYAQVPGGGFEQRAVVWVLSSMMDLGTLGGPQATAYAINEHGDIAGTATDGSLGWHATLWPVEGQPISLDTLGSTYSVAYAVNRDQEAAGVVILPGGVHRGFVWDAAAGMRDLAPLPGDTQSEAYGVHASGLVVGTSAHLAGEGDAEALVRRAVIWTDGPARALIQLISDRRWVLEQAHGINEAGQIVGTGRYKGEPRGFLLTPVPQPKPPAKVRVQQFVHALKARLAQERHAGR